MATADDDDVEGFCKTHEICCWIKGLSGRVV
jgi:hypothetical protein